MAKTSAIQKNLKRIKLVKRYAKKRAALKKIINTKKLDLSERFEAQLKLNKLPKNSAKIRIRIKSIYLFVFNSIQIIYSRVFIKLIFKKFIFFKIVTTTD